MENRRGDPDGGVEGSDKDRLIEELREAVRARDDFVAIAAHELRNPMTPILLQVHNLVTAVRDPARCHPKFLVPRLELLEHAVRDFVRRSTTLLDVSRIASGNVRIELSEVDVSRALQEVVERAEPAARMTRSRVEADLQDGVIGMLDRVAIVQVAENLVSNAIKFGAGKPVNVVLRSDGQTAHLNVRDQGIGISEEDRARIFQRFERAVTRGEHGGFGVGLWLVNQLVAAMGGTLGVESTRGRGSNFIVKLPLAGSTGANA